jgi:hypothetical protein
MLDTTLRIPCLWGYAQENLRIFNAFLIPFIEELNLLKDGVHAYDAHTQSRFLLKAHLVLISGARLVSRNCCISGHSAKFRSRLCKIQGVAYQIPFVYKSGPKKAQQYYPLHPPTTSLSARRHTLQSFRTDIKPSSSDPRGIHPRRDNKLQRHTVGCKLLCQTGFPSLFTFDDLNSGFCALRSNASCL